MLLLLSAISLIAQTIAPEIQWQSCFGGSEIDKACAGFQTSDGGYIFSGNARSPNGDVVGWHAAYFTDSVAIPDYWVVKLDVEGNIQWQKCLGGSLYDCAYSIEQCDDGGYIVGGKSYSNDFDVSLAHGDCDYWIVKLDEFGNIEWERSYGGSGADWGWVIRQTVDGYIVVGTSNSDDGDVSGNHGESDFWIVKLDAVGGIQWQKNL